LDSGCGFDFSGVDLSGLNLSGCCFHNVNLKNTNFTDAIITNSNLGCYNDKDCFITIEQIKSIWNYKNNYMREITLPPNLQKALDTEKK
jgi:uncharacterized protein YjbI with pentapeptide repeats